MSDQSLLEFYHLCGITSRDTYWKDRAKETLREVVRKMPLEEEASFEGPNQIAAAVPLTAHLSVEEVLKQHLRDVIGMLSSAIPESFREKYRTEDMPGLRVAAYCDGYLFDNVEASIGIRLEIPASMREIQAFVYYEDALHDPRDFANGYETFAVSFNAPATDLVELVVSYLDSKRYNKGASGV